jgi:glucose-6-phosphate-specific signal transduction histidine kinase
MMNEPIEQLLRDADTAAAVHESAPSVDAIFKRVQRRKTLRTTLQSLALAIFVGAMLVWSLSTDQHATVVRSDLHPPIDTSSQAINAELKSIDTEVARRELLVKKLLKIEDDTRRQIALRRRAAQRDPADDAQQEIEDAAFAMVYQANRIAQTAGNEPARNVYKEVVAYFPNTPSAEVARQRLTQ